MEENLRLRAKTEANFKPEVKLKVVWIACDKEPDGEMKSVNENFFKSSPENFQKLLSFREIYIKYLEKSQYIGIVYSYINLAFFTISSEIKNLWYTFDLTVNIWLINKKTCGINIWEKWVSNKKYFIFNASIY